MDYSAKVMRIEEILKSMESSAMPLEQMMSLYEEGQRLLGECREFLAKAEGKIKKLENDGSLSSFASEEE